MKARYIITAFFAAAMLTAAAAVIVLRPQPAPVQVTEALPTGQSPFQIQLSSAPYPLAVGQATLLIALLDASGQPVEGAMVAAASQMKHPGMLPIQHRVVAAEDGEYQAAVVWPMTGQWVVDVTAQMPGTEETVSDQFDVFVYPVPVESENSRTTFRSLSENLAAVSDPARELRLVLPQGTLAMVRSGQGADLIPTEIRLDVSGQNTLVIQNDDIADHTIGPFFVRAGETVRQEFTRPAVYEGACSILPVSGVSIIVEE